MAYMPNTPFYPPQNTNKPIPSAGPGPSVPSWELPPPPQQPGSDTPATAGGFDRDAWLQRWRDQRRAIRQPINSGANQLPQPSIRGGRGQVPIGSARAVGPTGAPNWFGNDPGVESGFRDFMGGRLVTFDTGPNSGIERARREYMNSIGKGPQYEEWHRGRYGGTVMPPFQPGDPGYPSSAPSNSIHLPPQGVTQGEMEMQPPTDPFEPEMPAWMRARLRRNPGGGGELGRGRGPRSGGKPPMQSMPVGTPQSPPPPQQPWVNRVPNGYASGRPPGFMAEQDPRFGGFDFMF